MKNFLKRSTSFLLSLTIICSLNTVSFASEENNDYNAYVHYAEIWAKNVYESSDVTIDNLIPLENALGDKNGYCITFTKDEQPSGYLVVNLYDLEDPVKEYAIAGNSIFEDLNYSINTYSLRNYSLQTSENSLSGYVYVSPFEYGVDVLVNGKEYIYTNEQEIINKQEYINSSIKDTDSGIALFSAGDHVLDPDELEGFSSLTRNINKLDNFKPMHCNNLFEPDGSMGNCKFVASTNIMLYLSEQRGYSDLMLSRKYAQNAYNRLSDYRTSEGGMPKAITKYMKYKGYSNSSCNVSDKYASFSDISANISNNNPILLYFGDGDGVDHAVFACGYDVRIINNKSNYFIRVADGWHANINRYIHFKDKNDSTNALYKFQVIGVECKK